MQCWGKAKPVAATLCADMGTTGKLLDRKILIVDDDADIRASFEAAIASEGAQTLTTADGNDAIRLVAEESPELVVLDMMLPKRSGFLVLEKIKGYEESPAVIMVTANEGKRHEAYAQSLGVDDYLQKPVPLSKLIDTAARLLARRDEVLGIDEVVDEAGEAGEAGEADEPGESGEPGPGSAGGGEETKS
jgi:DNA-binding response OmpR family regulator